MIELEYKQNHCESGSITGNGIHWWWSGREAHGNLDATEVIGDSVIAAIREEWGDHIDEDLIHDLPVTAQVEWDGECVENVTALEFDFEFDKTALAGPEETLAEVQEFFTSPVTLTEPLKAGKNTARVGDKTFTVRVD